ncbi:hypothetical protein Kpol_1067p28 [Vanderwaltozyma polyspora DSM 70294]|uniref:DNA helicase n=1 Tax=Vanderwaltozyma polyspora (strain ATCC 22028 / DSM 70294 / BCRC 21397 / CBS 2163 / NBRC 10782 / NRRL Y-8283 / UCD 57-17) TaxID=436907 RepID=A7TNX2_VANPO|nr:uncharacterized protein Kpol_1067p28 [Vanderwaltozyma polyspora DSM 70294]EDO16055.1 hypothetical protein Kpol_1067p28 [Vanderwaltozyma polyspora DSM 70294]
MSDSEADLSRLGVNILSQSSLEQRIESDASSLINKQLLEQELNRLDRANNSLDKSLTKKRLLERKLANTSRISVKQRLREQIDEINKNELNSIRRDIKDIKGRISDAEINISGTSRPNLPQGRKEGESEHDYLIRTGQITAFGSKTGFKLENEESDLEHISDNDFKLANQQMVENISDKSDGEYVLDGNEEDIDFIEDEFETNEDLVEIKSQPGETRDDGDELVYQKRLKKWIQQRSSDRKVDKYPDLPEWRKPHPHISDAKLNDEFRIPGDIYSLLFNYQKTCVQWLYELNQQKCGGIIGDEMGLGKTIQIIAYLASLHHSGLLDGPILIVCPATVMKQWCNELHHWWPPLRTVILHAMGAGMSAKKKISEEELENLIMTSNAADFSYDEFTSSSKVKSQLESSRSIQELIDKVVNDGHVIITTYVGLRLHSDKLLKVNWSYAVLDEGHKIRNPDSEISLTCKKLRTRNRIILSGTPIQNNLNELWSLFDFIFPGKLGTLPVFQQQFVMPINMGGYANATNIQVQTGYKCAVALRDLVSPYLLRRIKADVAKDLPDKREMVLFCKLTQFQRNKYIEFLNSKELGQIQNGKRQVLYGIDILRKICNHPDLLEKENRTLNKAYGDPKRSGKMQVVKQLLLLWKKEGHKTLLFTQSRQMLDVLEDFISFKDEDLKGFKYLRMDGTTNISHRQSLVDKFNNENYDVFLLTTRVGGLGVNLTGADRIIIFDPDWNPSTDMQARERAWRIGQKREVSIYRLLITGTIEEKIYHRQLFKQFLTNKILTDPKQKRFFKMNELHDLFSLGSDSGYGTDQLNEEVQKHTDALKSSRTEESDDFEQVVNIAGVSKLESFYNGKEKLEKSKTEDDRLMEGLLGDNFVESAKSHEEMINSHAKSSFTIIEREATKVANQAINALKESRKATKKYKVGTPTWTGKFGKAGKIIKPVQSKNKFGKPSIGSQQILANIKQTQKEASIQSKINEPKVKFNEDQNTIIKMESYLKAQQNCFASSSSIIENIGIKLTERDQIIKVRALLKTIATFNSELKGWILKEEFRDK